MRNQENAFKYSPTQIANAAEMQAIGFQKMDKMTVFTLQSEI